MSPEFTENANPVKNKGVRSHCYRFGQSFRLQIRYRTPFSPTESLAYFEELADNIGRGFLIVAAYHQHNRSEWRKQNEQG